MLKLAYNLLFAYKPKMLRLLLKNAIVTSLRVT